MRKTALILILASLAAACSIPSVSRTDPPTAIPSATLQPTITLTPTMASPTLSMTPTVQVVVSATAEGTPRPELRCKVLSQSVVSGSKFASKERFDISWQIQNTGSATWEPGIVELAYAGGTKMYRYQPVPLPHSSPPGDIIALSADMIAPHTPDVYTMFWSLRRGDEYFCRLAVTIKVHT